MMEKKEMQSRIQLHLLELLEERGLISASEMNAAKVLLEKEAWHGSVLLRKGAGSGKSGDL
ncbi:MAG: hypothetical protein K2H52_16515 [Lachnospiraceae bacterium]|nr:hypothetical protein [Lachnospiraceae bacterium]MDE6184553.1 hypothetical protein [Lachnospiraceae bacterium]